MADEKKQELAPEDLEYVGGGAQFPPCDKKKRSAATSDEDADVVVASASPHIRVVDEIGGATFTL